MATPLGHAMAGVLVGTLATWQRPLWGYGKDLALFAVLAMAADLDFVPGLLMGNPSAYHQGLSHSVGMAGLAGVVMGLWGARYGQAWRWALVGGLVYLSHPLVDYITMDTRPPLGVQLWWPMSGEHVQAPAQVFLNVRRESFTWEVISHDLLAIGRELLILGLPLAAVLWVRVRWRKGRE